MPKKKSVAGKKPATSIVPEKPRRRLRLNPDGSVVLNKNGSPRKVNGIAPGTIIKSTPECKAAFLAAYARCASLTRSAREAGIEPVTIYRWKAADPEFKVAFEDAIEKSTDWLEDEAIRRAAEGVDRPVFYRGMQCGVIREYSDNLLQFMLVSRRPDKFAPKLKQEITGSITVERVSFATIEGEVVMQTGRQPKVIASPTPMETMDSTEHPDPVRRDHGESDSQDST